jgi:hypothetical protein
MASPGCIAFHTYRDVRFHVVDAESNEPVPHATIAINYQGMGGMIPDDVSGTTDANGVLDMRIARGDFAYIEIAAPGYQKSPANPELFHPPAEKELRVYRLPLPYRVLVVPQGTRGLMEVRMSLGESARTGSSGNPPPPGKRAVLTTLSTSSVVYAPTLPRLGEPFSDYERIFAAQFGDGREIPFWYPESDSPSAPRDSEDRRMATTQPVAEDSFGLWFIGRVPLGWGASRMFFYAGTLKEAIAAQNRLKQEWKNDRIAREMSWAPALPPTP